jgi:hypothetical protein
MLGCLICGLAAFTAPAAATSTASPRLAALDLAPLTVRGLNFRTRERVRVVLRVQGEVYTRRLTATMRGRFVVRYLSVTADQCTPYIVSALGSKGSRAALKAVPECAAP